MFPPKLTAVSLEKGRLPRTRKFIRCPTYHQLTHPPRRGPHPLTHLPRRLGPHRLIHPPRRRGPHRLIQTPALASGAFASQVPPNATAAIAAPDHLPMLRRNKRLSSNCCSFSDGALSEDGGLFIVIEDEVYSSVSPVSVEKCMAAISHFPPCFVAVSDMLTGNSNSFPSFVPVTFPDVSIQPVSPVTWPMLNS